MTLLGIQASPHGSQGQRQLSDHGHARREAVLSSKIEGTQSSLSDVLVFELDDAPGAPFDDVVEVSNYVAAVQQGDGLPDRPGNRQGTDGQGPQSGVLLRRVSGGTPGRRGAALTAVASAGGFGDRHERPRRR
ncbi:MAG: hypothetical protein EBR86_15095 [Planctomycetia bacterium]|nr:hypothetical protein [Planctomycetia bacterium]